MKRYLQYIGCLNGRPKHKPVKKASSYYSADMMLAERHLSYLKTIEQYQNERRSAIENKNSQLVGQASLVTSILALFIPLLIDNLATVHILARLAFVTLFIAVLFHYLISIFHVLKTLKVDRYKYASRSSETIINISRPVTENGFVNEEINDLLFIIEQNTDVDNRKGDNLVYGSRCFEIANWGFGLITLCIIAASFWIAEKVPEVKISNMKDAKMEMPDTINARIQIPGPCSIKVDTIINNPH